MCEGKPPRGGGQVQATREEKEEGGTGGEETAEAIKLE
jgi:hypothetical protein